MLSVVNRKLKREVDFLKKNKKKFGRLRSFTLTHEIDKNLKSYILVMIIY